MNNVGEKFLPLGTVVMLKGASKRLMITGFCTMAAEDAESVMYDYSGCMYPEGMISSDQNALFNHDQIERIFHMGLVDQEEKDFKFKLNQLLSANSPVAESAPQAIIEQEVSVPVAPVAPVAEEELVPPIGPGLPGYVAPEAPVSNEFNVGEEGLFDVQSTNLSPVAPEVNGIQFDALGNVVAAPTVMPAPVAPTQEASAPNFQFDENGVLISS